MKKGFFVSFLLAGAVVGWVQSPNQSESNTLPPKKLQMITSAKKTSENESRGLPVYPQNAGSKLIAGIGDGYKTMASEFTTGSIFQKVKTTLVPNGGTYFTSFHDDLTEAELQNQMGIDISGTVPVKEVVVSPAFNYAHKAAKSRLSRTTTLIGIQNLGTLKIQPNDDQTFTIADGISRYLDSTGQLSTEKTGDFYKAYGDSVVVSQDLVGKIFITAKLSFDSVAVSDSFNGKLGASVASLFTGSGDKLIEINARFKILDEETKRHTTLTIVATQFGGVPGHLFTLFDSQASCSLDQLSSCIKVIDRLNDYIRIDFRSQLDPKDLNTWYAENIVVATYDSLNLTNKHGLQVNLTNSLNNPFSNVFLYALATRINRMITHEISNYDTASLMIESKNLSKEETSQALLAQSVSEQNFNKLKGFADYCYIDLTNCAQNAENIVKSFLEPYPTDLLNPRLGTLLAQVQSNFAPLQGQEHRSSVNFLNPGSLFASGLYSSFYFKVKTIDNNLVNNLRVRFDVTCDIHWTIEHLGYDQDILTSVYPGLSVFNDSINGNFKYLCAYDDAIYIRNPRGFTNTSLTIEMWGRE